MSCEHFFSFMQAAGMPSESYVYIYVHIYTYICIDTHAYINLYVYLSIYVHTCIHADMYTSYMTFGRSCFQMGHIHLKTRPPARHVHGMCHWQLDICFRFIYALVSQIEI